MGHDCVELITRAQSSLPWRTQSPTATSRLFPPCVSTDWLHCARASVCRPVRRESPAAFRFDWSGISAKSQLFNALHPGFTASDLLGRYYSVIEQGISSDFVGLVLRFTFQSSRFALRRILSPIHQKFRDLRFTCSLAPSLCDFHMKNQVSSPRVYQIHDPY